MIQEPTEVNYIEYMKTTIVSMNIFYSKLNALDSLPIFFHLFVKSDTLQNAPILLYVICTGRTILFYILYTTENYFKALFLEAFMSRPDM